jgi:hypothetical protein
MIITQIKMMEIIILVRGKILLEKYMIKVLK